MVFRENQTFLEEEKGPTASGGEFSGPGDDDTGWRCADLERQEPYSGRYLCLSPEAVALAGRSVLRREAEASEAECWPSDSDRRAQARTKGYKGVSAMRVDLPTMRRRTRRLWTRDGEDGMDGSC